jgi:ATP-dependent DNA helicase RecQ
MDVELVGEVQTRSPAPTPPPAAAIKSFSLFDEGLSVEETAQRLGRAMSTTYGYLEAYVRHRRVIDPSRWVEPRELHEIAAAAEKIGARGLKPIYDALDGRIGYERIRIAMACLENQAAASNHTSVRTP